MSDLLVTAYAGLTTLFGIRTSIDTKVTSRAGLDTVFSAYRLS